MRRALPGYRPLLLPLICGLLAAAASTQHLLRTHQLPAPANMPTTGPAADLDRDGFPEYLTATRTQIRIHAGADGRILQRIAAPGSNIFTPITLASATDDLDGDGFAELIYSDGWFKNGNNQVEGAVRVYEGRSLLSATPKLLVAWRGTSSSLVPPNLRSYAVVGDLDQDGFQDLVLGAERDALMMVKSGRWAVSRVGPQHLFTPVKKTFGFGAAVVGLGDVTGDGTPDFAAAHIRDNNSSAGAVYVYDGKTGAQHHKVLPPANSAPRFFGQVLHNIGDVDGDGFADLAAGSFNSLGNSGSVAIFSGKDLGLKRSQVVWSKNGVNSERYGTTLAGLGDIDNDSFDDFAVAADGTSVTRGRVEIYRGGRPPSQTALRVFRPTAQSGTGGFGDSLHLAPDVNGDSRPDILAGTWSGSGTGGGFLEILSVDPVLLTTPIDTLPWATGGTQQFDMHGGAHAGAAYVLLGNYTGRKPGFSFLNVHVPLNPDPLLTMIPHPFLTNAVGFLGKGVTTASLNLPPLPPSTKGLVLAHAYAVLRGGQLVTVSNAVPLRID